MLTVIGLLHFGCDWVKVHFTEPMSIASFVGDQIAHILILALCAWYFTRVQVALDILIIYPALVYVAIPALTVFLFVMGNDLANRGVAQPRIVRWGMEYGLTVSHYFSRPLVVMLCLTIFL